MSVAVDRRKTLNCPRVSVADPDHVDTDPRFKKIRYGSGSRANLDDDTDPDPAKKD